MDLVRKFVPRILQGWVARLRFPQLFVLTVVLFLVNLVVPDGIPLFDEILLGLVSLLLASVKEKAGGEGDDELGSRENGGRIEA